MNKEKVKDIIVRMLKTFIQGFLSALVISFQSGEVEVTKAMLIGGLAGGISALMNFTIRMLERSE